MISVSSQDSQAKDHDDAVTVVKGLDLVGQSGILALARTPFRKAVFVTPISLGMTGHSVIVHVASFVGFKKQYQTLRCS